MARYKLQGRAVDTYGNIQPNIGITIYLAGTTTPAMIYVSEDQVPPGINTAPQVETDQYGRFDFWVDRIDYDATQYFDIYAGSLGYTDVDIFRGGRVHGELMSLDQNDHPQYANLTQSERISGTWIFLEDVVFMGTINVSGNVWADRLFTKTIKPSGDYELVSKNYVDNLTFTTSGATVAYVDMRDKSISASSQEHHNRQQEYIEMMNASLSASSLEGDRTERDYTNMRITSLSGSTDENVNRLYEYIDLENNTQTYQLSAASLEGDRTLQENIDTLDTTINTRVTSVSASSLEGDRTERDYTNMMLDSTSASSREQDQRLQENINTLDVTINTRVTNTSAASIEQDNRVREYAATITGVTSAATIQYVDEQNDLQTAEISASSLEGDRRLYEYIDLENNTQTLQLSAASVEGDNRIWEDLGNLTGEVRSFEASAGESLRDLQGRMTTHEISAKGLFDEQRGRLTSLEASASERFYDLELIHEDTKEPTGFLDRFDSVHYNDISTHTFYLSGANSGTFDIYIKGVKHTIDIASVQWTDADGLHYFYFDENAQLQHTTVFSSSILTDYAFAHIMYWDSDAQQIVLNGDERHGAVMDGVTHWYLHTTRGTVWESGLGITGIDADQDGSSDLHAYLEINGGIIWDEDLRHVIETLPPTATSHILYREDNKWKITQDTLFPVRNYSGGSGLVAWNNVSGSGVQVEAASGSYVLAHIYAINDYDYPIVGIQGQAEYTDLEEARIGATTEILNLVTDTLPFVEFVPVGSIIYQTSPSFTNSVKARIVSTDEGLDYVDFRAVRGAPTGAISTNDHSNLSGLDGDDHLQYALINGDRDFTQPIGGVTPIAGSDFTTKNYVDTEITTLSTSLSASSLEGDRRLDTRITSISGASLEGDRRLQENIDNIETLPTGGTINQVLTKQSSVDGDADWNDVTITRGSGVPVHTGVTNEVYVDYETGDIYTYEQTVSPNTWQAGTCGSIASTAVTEDGSDYTMYPGGSGRWTLSTDWESDMAPSLPSGTGFYAECTLVTGTSNAYDAFGIGFSIDCASPYSAGDAGWIAYNGGGNIEENWPIYTNRIISTGNPSWDNGETLAIAWKRRTSGHIDIWFKNTDGNWVGGGDPSLGTTPTQTWSPADETAHAGQLWRDQDFGLYGQGQYQHKIKINTGNENWVYSVPTGFVAFAQITGNQWTKISEGGEWSTITDSLSAASKEQDQRIYEYGDTNWSDGGVGLPSGGVVNDILVKQSSDDGDADWTYNINDNLSSSTTLWSAQQIIETLSISASIVLYGDGDPTSILGGPNNYYIDSLTGNIWKKDTVGYSSDITGTGTPSSAPASFSSNVTSVFDDNPNTEIYLQTSVGNDWIGYDFGTSKTITQFSIMPRNGYEERQPDSVNVYGSVEGKYRNEVLIEEVTLDTWSTQEFHYFPFDNNIAYQSYRFEATNSPTSGYWDTAEMELMETSSYSWGLVWDNETRTQEVSGYLDTKITSVSAASKESDNKLLPLDGSRSMTGNLNTGNNDIIAATDSTGGDVYVNDITPYGNYKITDGHDIGINASKYLDLEYLMFPNWSDSFVYKTVSDVEEYASGSWSSSSLTARNLVDNNPITNISLTPAVSGVRFIVNAGTYLNAGMFQITQPWSTSHGQKAFDVKVETSTDTSFASPTTILDTSVIAGRSSTSHLVNSHTSESYYRISITVTDFQGDAAATFCMVKLFTSYIMATNPTYLGLPYTTDYEGNMTPIGNFDGVDVATFKSDYDVHTHPSSDVTDFGEAVDDQVATLLTAGPNIQLTYDDGAGTLEISGSAGGGTGLPDGGTADQVLVKQSSVDGDADWNNLSSLLTGEFEWCYVNKISTTETVNNASPGPTTVGWDGQIRVDDNFTHSTSTNPERITVTEDGYYLLNVGLIWNCGTTDRTAVYIDVYKNGSVFTHPEARSYNYLRGNAYNDNNDTNLTTVIPLSASDYIDIRATQEYSDGTNGATTETFNAYLKLIKLSPTKGEKGDTGDTGATGATGDAGQDGIVTFGSAPSGAYADFQSDYTKIYAPRLYIGTSDGYFEDGETSPSGTDALGYNGYLYATRVYNAVYNDIADFQALDDHLIYGKCYYRGPNGMKICNERLQKGVVGIASDTYGYGLGSREDGVPLAIGGWVLAYVEGYCENGDPLTVNENGNLTKMHMWEKVFYPERIVAIYQYKEQEENWNDIIVNNRHWVKIK